ncbi:MAG: 16S rRNA (adenine(1518)-N(6)/adenine(1519)-N(6))-dimethyltransferase, partial [Chlamydiia bacterium]|nr:16S rRNA (adenine(1518)-N(6)/adenine(1519)-N(6))-dimethyltransferase [Chlamydiia bacterium]
LTEFLLPQAATVTAIEKETRFIPHLKARFPTLHLIHGDALETDYTSLPSPPTKVVANIPYNITSHLLEILFAKKIKTLTLITQHDLAKRIVAIPQTKDYGPLTLLAQFYSLPKLIAKISPHCFYPEPNVDSALLHFTLHTHPLPPSDIPSFFTFCRHTFTMRRKTLRKILQIPLDSFLEKHNLSPNARPEELSLPLWIQLWGYVKK